jgi:hypothetical protein
VAAVALEVVTPDTGNTPNASGAFAPAVNDLLVVFVMKEASALASPMVSADLTSSVAPTGFTLIRTAGYLASASHMAVFVADALCTNTTSRTVTIASGADPAAGSIICVLAVSGLTRVGADAVRQSGVLTDQATGIPSLTFDTGVALTGNPIVGAIGTPDGTPALTAPASFAENADTGYTTGSANGIHVVSRDSGHTSQTVAWQTASATGTWGGIIVELDTSGPTENDDPTGTINLTGTRVESANLIDSRSGQITLSGSAVDDYSVLGPSEDTGFVATQLQAVTRAANW